MEENKKNVILQKIKMLLKKWWFWTSIVVLIILIILMIILNKPKFEIDDFNIEKNIIEYEYIEDSITYSGEGEITTNDKKGVYLVALKKILVEGRKRR